MTLPDAISFLYSRTSEGQDLPEELFRFISTISPLVNVDLLIKDDTNRTLLTWRDDEHYGAGWHVPGGIIRFKESGQLWRACDRLYWRPSLLPPHFQKLDQ